MGAANLRGGPCAQKSSQAPSSPDYALPIRRNVRTLSELQGGDPLALRSPRSLWSEKASAAPGAGRQYEDRGWSYTQVPRAKDETHTRQEFRASVGAQWPFLSTRRPGPADLDIAEDTNNGQPTRMIPHTLVLTRGLGYHRIYKTVMVLGPPFLLRTLARPGAPCDTRRSARDGI